jgi:ACS family hexuronate transporter-like MFS transporter
VITGVLGFLWVIAWRASYHPPERHPRISAEERRMILDDRAAEGDAPASEPPPPAAALLRLPQTWGTLAARGLTDPVWFMITDWFAIYLVSRGFDLEKTALGFWVPFLAADLGNFFGGGVSSAMIRRGSSVGRARRTVIVGGGFGVLALVPAALSSDFFTLVACFAIATFSYAAMSTMAIALPADLFENRAVATVAGLSGAAAGTGTLASTYLIGVIADRFSFTPILITASVVPLAAAALVVALVRNGPQSGRGLLKVI